MNSQREAFEKWWIDLALTSDTPHWFTHDGKEAARAAWQAATEQGVGEAAYSIEADLEETQKTLSAAEAKIEEYEGFFTGEDGDNHGGDAKAIINDYLRTPTPKPTGGVCRMGGSWYRLSLQDPKSTRQNSLLMMLFPVASRRSTP